MEKNTIFTLLLTLLPAITLSAADPMHIEYEKTREAFPEKTVYWPGLEDMILEVPQEPRQSSPHPRSGRMTPLLNHIRREDRAAGRFFINHYNILLMQVPARYQKPHLDFLIFQAKERPVPSLLSLWPELDTEQHL